MVVKGLYAGGPYLEAAIAMEVTNWVTPRMYSAAEREPGFANLSQQIDYLQSKIHSLINLPKDSEHKAARALSQEDSASGIVLGKEFSTSLVLFQEAIAARLGLNATDYRCLEVILRKGQLTAKALAGEVRLTTGAITGIVDHLEKAGYVERLENPVDRRSVIIRSTTTHRELEKKLGDAMSSYRTAMSKVFAKYDADQTAAIVDFLTEFVKVLKTQTARLRDESAGG